MNAGLIAFHELVSVKSWADSSSRGPSIKVQLASRDSLTIFDKVTKRAGKRAGQRYHSVWQADPPDAQPPTNLELWFAGANWSHQDGASVKFSVLDLEAFRDGTLPIEGDEPIWYWLTLVQIDDDEKPIDQGKAEQMEALKGGPKSKRVAMLCQQRDFQAYVTYRTNVKVETMDAADAWVKEQCGVASKVEFDHNADAWSMFEARVMSPFIRWEKDRGGRMKPKTIREHWDRVADLGCLLCGASEPTLHHCHGGSLREIGVHKGLGQKTSDYLVIPLAERFHTGEYGIDVIPVWDWENRFGSQVGHLDDLCRTLGYNVWTLAGVERSVVC